MKRTRILLSLATGSFYLYFLVAGIDYQAVAFAADDDEACETEIPEPDEDILTIKGNRIKIIDAGLYRCVNGKWLFRNSLIANFGKRFEIRKTDDKCILRVLQTGKKHTLTSYFSSGFEESRFLDLFKTGGWTITTLQSPKTNTIKQYMQLNNELMKGGKFLDNRMDLDMEIVHSGKKALRFYAVKPDKSTKKVRNVSKSLIEKKTLCFAKGDHIWFSAWYYLKKGMPSTLFDFETRRILGGPGIRLFIRRGKYATLELKDIEKQQYSQFEVPIPRQRWFNLKMHLVLSNHDDGIIELWQDGVKILSTRGKTLFTHDTIYNSMEVGITATQHETTLLVDDVIVSNKPF